MTIEQIKEAADYIKSQGVDSPKFGIVLGTGLGNLVTKIEKIIEIDYADIPHFPVSTVESHHGKLIYGTVEGKKVLAMQGRFHFYEGYTMQQITFPIRVMKLLNIEKLLISNAAGTVNPEFKKGSLMLIDDHINMLPANPLTGKNLDELGPRFPDMSQPYDAEMNGSLEQIATDLGITLHKGVYTPVAGPNLETRAEYRYLRIIGTDAVGMSTVPEVIVARQLGLEVLGLSVLTDECDPDHLQPIDIPEIMEMAKKGENDFIKIVKALVATL